jgi:NifU-like protein
MTPLELLDDHARRPRNIGKLLNASAVGDVGSIVIGDALRLYIKVEGEAPEERLAALKFQVFNSQAQLGAASVITELAQGKTLTEAVEIGVPEVCAHLGGLSHLDLPARLWASDGLRAAIATWQGTEVPADIELERPLLCRCLGIPEETVRQAIAVRALTDIDAVVAATTAGSRCGSCRIDISSLLDAASAKPAAAPAAAAPVTRIQLLARINACAREVLAPYRAQGGDLELWDLQGGRIQVRARGSLAANDDARREAMAALEVALKSQVDPTLSIAP